jgi:hypothetical protein
MYFKSIIWGYVDLIYLDQDRNKWGGGGVVNAVMKLRFPYVSFQEFFSLIFEHYN